MFIRKEFIMMKRKNNKNNKLFGISGKDLNKAGRQIGIAGSELFIGTLKVAGKVLPAKTRQEKIERQDRIYENTRVLRNMKKEDAKLSGKNPKNSPSVQKTEKDLEKELEKLNNLKGKTSKANGKSKGRK